MRVLMVSFAEKPTLTGERVLLRPVAVGDAQCLLDIDPETLRLTGAHRTFDLATLEAWYATRADHDDRLDLAIVSRADGSWLGEVVLNLLDPPNRSCNFRVLLSGPAVYGRGFGTEATRLVLAHAFDTVGLHRVELEVFAFNRGCGGCTRRSGSSTREPAATPCSGTAGGSTRT